MAPSPTKPCMSCDRETPRAQVLAKVVRFTTLGASYKIRKSRTIGYLCPKCLEKDSDYTVEPYMQQRMSGKKQVDD
jgi:hypothetical protein